MFKDLQNLGVLKKEGYRINLKNISKEDLNLIKKQLTLVPKVHKDFIKNVIKYKCYSINEKYIYLPKYWALEKIGEPKKNLLKRGEYFNQKLETIYPPRPFQVEIIDKTYKQLKEIGGGIITVSCGQGKTYMSINISTLINQKTLIIVHTSVLLDQWMDRIKYFIPNAKIGIIQGKKFDIENKDYVIAMLQTIIRSKSEEDFKSFGLTIYDEAHHMAAPSFSKAFPIVSSKYNLGLSATPKRSDNLQNIFYWNIGPTSFESFTNDKFAIVKNINFTDDNYVEKYNWMGSIDLHKLHLQIIDNDFRNEIIIKQLVNLSKKGRQILVLSKLINHLRTLKTNFCKKKYYKNYPRKIIFEICKKKKINKKCFSLICSFIKIPVTCGYYIGGMKQSVDQSVYSKTHKELDQLIFNNIDKIKPENLKYIYNKNNKLRKKINLNREDKINIVEEANIEIEIDDSIESLEKSSKCDILFASYQLVSEGTDIATLNTLIMTTPKKQIQQVVGRILRAKTKFTPLILDIVDSSFSVYKNQSFYRNRYYRKCNYSIENIDINAKDKKIPLIGEEIIIEEKTMEQICDNFIKCLI
jgi:superfamily II DNA or RNA helicase